MEEKAGNAVPQFATAEYPAQPGGAMRLDSHSAFVRGICFGIGAAILGLALYAGFALATGWIVGFVSLAVGYIVGKAIVFGSRGVGGRRYQVAAVLLTYIAVSMAAVPIAIYQQTKHRSAQQQAHASDPATAGEPKMSPLRALGVLTAIGLASPFLDLANPAHGVIGLIILFVGIRIAWRLTAARAMNITAPNNDPAPAAPR
jgi:hypothetical protein